MERKTVSDGFRAQLGEQEWVVAALFTTYRFEPEFFEQEIIPLMLDQSLAFSSDQRIKAIQVREALANAGLPLEVFYDIDLFRAQGTVSPAMEYLHHGIRGERSAFHAKLILLLLEDSDSGELSLCVGAGSANLTIAGWWENIECWHWERVYSGEVSRRFLNQLREDVAWLAARRKGGTDSPNHALPRIAAYLEACKASHNAPLISWYGISSLSLAQKRRPAFMRFMRDALNEQSPNYRRWALEIISPYFADSPNFDGQEYFIDDLGVEMIRIFLPVNDQGEALCRRDYYEKIANTEGIEWATWSPEMEKELGLKGVNRTTHAKIYHLYNGMQSWVFVGSVNFTHRATSDNQEAGFFTQLPRQVTLLTPLKVTPDKWCPEEQLPGADSDEDKGPSLPDLVLQYDWKQRELTALLRDGQSMRCVLVDILSPEGGVSLADIRVTSRVESVACEPESVEALLKNSGFLRVRGTWLPDDEAFPEHNVMAQQLHWTHKPLDLPLLSPQEILQIYAGLSQIRRNQVIEFLKSQQLREMGLLGESAGSVEYQDHDRQFFAEYAELFHAFRNLRKRMGDAWAQGRVELVDYYLSGRGLDSLPTLLESLYDEETRLDVITVYLALLCLIQIYKQPEYLGRPQTIERLSECEQKLLAIETSGEIKLIDDHAERRSRFFAWYREQFFRAYRAVDDGGSNAAY